MLLSGPKGGPLMADEKNPAQTHTVTLTFDRPVTEEEMKQMQLQHKAISAAPAGGHHDDVHHHPKLL
jgi:nitrogen fixation protein FixH